MKKTKEKISKVLIASTSSDYGGGPKVVFDFLSHSKDKKFTFLVTAPPGGIYIQKFRDIGLKVYEISIDKISFKTGWDFYNLVKKEKVDLINSHGKGAGFYARIVGVILRVPVVHTFHGIHVEQKLKIARLFYIFAEKILSIFTTKIINVSKSQEEQGLILGLFPKSKSEVVYNGVDIKGIDKVYVKREEFRKELNLKTGDFVLTMVARFDPVKGHKRLVKFLSRIGKSIPIKLLFVGDGPEKSKIEKLVQDLGINDYVEFLGYRDDVYRILKISDVFVLSSYREGLPTGILEAMACGLPTIGSNSIGIKEVIIDDKTGYLIDFEKDMEKFKKIVNRLYTNEILRNNMGNNARKIVAEKYSIEKFAIYTANIYKKVLSLN